MREQLLIGNWKLHGTQESVRVLSCQLKNEVNTEPSTKAPQIVVLPPAIFISQVAEYLKKSPIAWGGQNMSQHQKGAYTGEISGDMLVAFNCRYVLLGHSERRQYYGETDQQIASKLTLAQKLGLVPILCLGETWQQYQSGQTEATLLNQLNTYFVLGGESLKNLVIAYEPIWAIGTGKNPSPLQVQTIHQKLRAYIAYHLSNELAHQIRILYGGSVKPDNAKALFAMPDIDGGLIGSASLSAHTFLQIYRSFL